MPQALTSVPVRDLRDTAAFTRFVEQASEPIIVTKNGYRAFTALNNDVFDRLWAADAENKLLTRMLLAQQERAAGETSDLLADIAELEAQYDL